VSAVAGEITGSPLTPITTFKERFRKQLCNRKKHCRFNIPCISFEIIGESRLISPSGRRTAIRLLLRRASNRGGIVKQDNGRREGM
jgi:hypothetical protein